MLQARLRPQLWAAPDSSTEAARSVGGATAPPGSTLASTGPPPGVHS